MVRLTRVGVMSGEQAVILKNLEGNGYSADPCNTEHEEKGRGTWDGKVMAILDNMKK